MYSVQLAIGNAPYSGALSDLLAHSESCCVTAVERPDPRQPGVLVVNEDALDSLPLPLERPERVVLITHKEPKRLEHAWEAGIRCVVFDSDPPRTMALAIMAAALRVRTPNPADGTVGFPQSPHREHANRLKTG
jgi:hypothetical protein